ncbi:MAG: serine protease [Planctomycetales bacterium]|nr:serine protease [Planctomycetales bacterium]
MSALHGVISVVAPLDAGKGAFRVNYRGDVYIVDAHANNPGAAGGALVGWDGRLLGILGKELESRQTGAWLNFALPIDVCVPSIEAIRAGEQLPDRSDETPPPLEPMSFADLGVLLVPNVLARTPPFVDAVRLKSPAAYAGLRSDDLVAFVAGQPVASCDEAIASLARIERTAAVTLGVLRDGAIVDVALQIGLQADDASVPDEKDEKLDQHNASDDASDVAGTSESPDTEESP